MKFNIFQPYSLKTRVTLFTLFIFVSSIWTLSFYVSHMLRVDLKNMVGQQQFSSVAVMAAEVNQKLEEKLTGLKIVAASITPAMMRNTANLQKQLVARPLLHSQFNAGIFVTRLDGEAIADLSHIPKRVGNNFMNQEVIAAALKNGESTIGRPTMGKLLKAPVFGMAVPIRDAEGKVIGALAGITNLGAPNFLDHFTANHYGKTGSYIIVARAHRLVVTSTDKSRIMQELPPPGKNPAIDRFIQGYEGYAVYTNQRGEEVLTSSKLVPVADWGFGASLPTAEAFAPIRDMQQRILFSTFILTLLAGGLTWFMLRQQLSPLRAAVNTLTRMSKSRSPDETLNITRHDEIGDLLSCFNRLLKTLGQREEEVRRLADYDQLTQLPNRRLLDDRLGQAMAASKRSGKYAALMFIDLDNFKPLNDTYGHVVGDLLLIEAANRLKNCVRETDTVARFGGDEFVVILSDLNTGKDESIFHAEIVAEKIRANLSQPYLLTIKQEGEVDTSVEHHCTTSIGVTLFIDQLSCAADIIKWADTAMYQAKNAGRNTIRFLDINVFL